MFILFFCLCILKLLNGKLRVASCELRVTTYSKTAIYELNLLKLRVVSCELNLESASWSSELGVASELRC